MSESNHSRRTFLKGAGLAGAAAVLNTACSSTGSQALGTASGKARNVIFLVADGMGTGTLSLAHHWSLRNQSKHLNRMELYQRPDLVTAMQDTASASSPVTDSAAASSSWGCGQRVNNGSINTSVAGKSLTPIMSLAKRAGKATGLVTTCRVTHATPAGFAANVRHRDSEDQIADQYFDRGIDVILGGGRRHFEREERNLMPEFQAAGYALATNRTELKKASGQARVLGLFSESHVPYQVDRENDPALSEVPGLTEMFETALQSLSHSPKGFVLQVEAGRVDHGCHVNDAAATLHEMLEFDRCIRIATNFIDAHPDTLLIITTDHGTGGCQLNGWGEKYSESGPALERINGIRASFAALETYYLQLGQFDAAHFSRLTGIQPSESQVAAVNEAITGNTEYLSSAMTQIFGDDLLDLIAVGWTSNNHTSECVELLALGPGSERIPAFVENYKINGIMRQSLGLAG
ncbi:alkaline phosphatase [Coraliomargarita parva]|uniref:alkaline phosphatase n=1 Tax=Coraliomargarita parva TaxID=3014050 RepID=UPI0022B3F1DC|nr:alkaline phosphatase [Coraliomargarita parva]